MNTCREVTDFDGNFEHSAVELSIARVQEIDDPKIKVAVALSIISGLESEVLSELDSNPDLVAGINSRLPGVEKRAQDWMTRYTD